MMAHPRRVLAYCSTTDTIGIRREMALVGGNVAIYPNI